MLGHTITVGNWNETGIDNLCKPTPYATKKLNLQIYLQKLVLQLKVL